MASASTLSTDSAPCASAILALIAARSSGNFVARLDAANAFARGAAALARPARSFPRERVREGRRGLGAAREVHQRVAVRLDLGRRRADRGLPDQARDLVDVLQARVFLRLGEQHRVTDGLRAAFAQQVHHRGVQRARPREAAEVADALFVDRDDRDLVAGHAVTRAHAEVVGVALEALEAVAERAVREREEDHCEGQCSKPVLRPEAFLHE
jgi:hypothetical protein